MIQYLADDISLIDEADDFALIDVSDVDKAGTGNSKYISKFQTIATLAQLVEQRIHNQ